MRLISAREESIIAARVAELAQERDQLRAANADLLATVLALKTTGAAPPLPKKVDRVSEVIADVAGSNAPLRRQLGAHVRAQRIAKRPDDEILHSLLNWGEDAEGAPE